MQITVGKLILGNRLAFLSRADRIHSWLLYKSTHVEYLSWRMAGFICGFDIKLRVDLS